MIQIIIGLFIIGIGFLVKSFPNLIAGYNTMSEEKKKNVDIVGLSTSMRDGLIAIGLIIIFGYYIFKWLGFISIANAIMPFVIFVGIPFLVIEVQKFDHNKTKKINSSHLILKSVILLHLLAFLFAIGLITYGFIPSKATYDNDTIRFSGMHGFELSIDEIESIELSDKLPEIKMRTNGFSLGKINKGFFQLDKFGKGRLLVHSDLAPYLILTKENGEKIIINFKDKNQTEKIYEKIKMMKTNQ